jgi:hypothetical protein
LMNHMLAHDIVVNAYLQGLSSGLFLDTNASTITALQCGPFGTIHGGLCLIIDPSGTGAGMNPVLAIFALLWYWFAVPIISGLSGVIEGLLFGVPPTDSGPIQTMWKTLATASTGLVGMAVVLRGLRQVIGDEGRTKSLVLLTGQVARSILGVAFIWISNPLLSLAFKATNEIGHALYLELLSDGNTSTSWILFGDLIDFAGGVPPTAVTFLAALGLAFALTAAAAIIIVSKFAVVVGIVLSPVMVVIFTFNGQNYLYVGLARMVAGGMGAPIIGGAALAVTGIAHSFIKGFGGIADFVLIPVWDVAGVAFTVMVLTQLMGGWNVAAAVIDFGRAMGETAVAVAATGAAVVTGGAALPLALPMLGAALHHTSEMGNAAAPGVPISVRNLAGGGGGAGGGQAAGGGGGAAGGAGSSIESWEAAMDDPTLKPRLLEDYSHWHRHHLPGTPLPQHIQSMQANPAATWVPEHRQAMAALFSSDPLLRRRWEPSIYASALNRP